VHLRAEPGVDAIKAIRALLKMALRRFGLRAVDVRGCEPAFVSPSPRSRPTRETSMSEFSKRIRSSTRGFYKVADLEGGKELTLTISRLDEAIEVFGEVKDVLNFIETGRQLQLNQTTAEWLLDNLGDDTAKWNGKKVVLHLADYKFEGETKKGIRLKLPDTKPAAREGTIIPPARGDSTANARSSDRKGNGGRDLDDEIPF
jgi:hypothetical protein